MPTPDLFDFDTYRLANYDPARIRRALREHSAIYVNHLQVAQWIEQWGEGLGERSGSYDQSEVVEVLHEVIAHLRQADLVPGGPLLSEMDEATEARLREGHVGGPDH